MHAILLQHLHILLLTPVLTSHLHTELQFSFHPFQLYRTNLSISVSLCITSTPVKHLWHINETQQEIDLSTSCLNELKADPIKSSLPPRHRASHPATPPLPLETRVRPGSVQLCCHGDKQRDVGLRLKITRDGMPTVGSKQKDKKRRRAPSRPRGALSCRKSQHNKQTTEVFMDVCCPSNIFTGNYHLILQLPLTPQHFITFKISVLIYQLTT